MAEWDVTLVTEASFTCTVEAETEDEALELAFEQAPYSLCHQEVIEIGDWGIYEDTPGAKAQGLQSARRVGEDI